MRKFILLRITDNVNPDQFASIPRPGSGATSALVSLQHKILQHLDSPGAVRILSVDFRKAFDMLPHTSIIHALSNFDVDPFVIFWVSNVLTDRKQRVHCNNSFSDWTPISSGVPQGSVLGPVLFCLVIDSLIASCSNTHLIKYADDVSFVHFIRSTDDDNLQNEWDSLIKWSSSICLPINYDKCCVMNIVTNKSLHLLPIFINDPLFFWLLFTAGRYFAFFRCHVF